MIPHPHRLHQALGKAALDLHMESFVNWSPPPTERKPAGTSPCTPSLSLCPSFATRLRASGKRVYRFRRRWPHLQGDHKSTFLCREARNPPPSRPSHSHTGKFFDFRLSSALKGSRWSPCQKKDWPSAGVHHRTFCPPSPADIRLVMDISRSGRPVVDGGKNNIDTCYF